MSARRLLFAQLLVAAALYVTQKVGLYYFPLDPNNGFFGISHFVGGVLIGLCVAWLLVVLRGYPSVTVCIVAGFAIGILWEYFEIQAGMVTAGSPRYWLDTTSDLVLDTLGAAFGALLSVKSPVFFKR